MAKKKMEEIDAPEAIGEVEAPVAEDTAEVADRIAVAEIARGIPKSVDEYLKTHTCFKAVYIDRLGGKYTEDAPEVFRKGATLYKNPYYKH